MLRVLRVLRVVRAPLWARDMIPSRDQWGPFASGIDPAERMARVRAFRVAVHVHCGAAGREATELLRQAEHARLEVSLINEDLLAIERRLLTDQETIELCHDIKLIANCLATASGKSIRDDYA